jgi:hypothetical protein
LWLFVRHLRHCHIVIVIVVVVVEAVLRVAMDASQEREDGRVPRLMIARLVLENFKSYAGRKEIGPFHKSFSSVVGPNGSGKRYCCSIDRHVVPVDSVVNGI